MVAVSPRLGGTNDRLDVCIVQATQAGQLIDDHLLFELSLGLVGDVLKVAATALTGAKVRIATSDPLPMRSTSSGRLCSLIHKAATFVLRECDRCEG